MQQWDDNRLLREYVEGGSEEAFEALAGRHINKVYSVALRHTRNPNQAEEITQAVFVILARKARSLLRHTSLSGWLFETARLTSVTFLKSEIRRARRNEEAFMQITQGQTESGQAWRQIAPLLDSAIAGLGAKEREAIVLRFFDGKSMKEVGAALDASEDAAKKRVERGLEKLRNFFARRGIASTTAVIAMAVAAHSVQAAPAGLAGTVCASAVKGGAVSASTLALAKSALKLITWTKLKIAGVIGASVILATAVVERDKMPVVFGALGFGQTSHVAYDELRGPVFSADGSHMVFAAKKAGKWQVIVDGREGVEYDNPIDIPLLGLDGKHVAYLIKNGNMQRVVVDGKEGAEYEVVRSLLLSPDGAHVAYMARQGGHWRVVLDERPGAWFEEVHPPVFSADGKRLAYIAKSGEEWFAVVDGKRSGPAEEIRMPNFSADGKRVGYAARVDGRWRIVVDGQEDAWRYDEARSPVFSADGLRMAFNARKGDGWRMVVDGQEGAPYPDDIRDAVFSADGKHVAYPGMARKTWHMVVDGNEGQGYDKDIRNPTFSPDGKRVAYAGKNGRNWRMVVGGDGDEGSDYGDDIRDPVFSSDSKRVAYAGMAGQKWRVVVDSQEGPEYGGDIHDPVFSRTIHGKVAS